jgi:formate dehydrogenase subunit gamma
MSGRLVRYNENERVNHWIVAILFVLAGLSGLAFFHPAMFWLTNLFGGGPWTRILHPYLGLAMFLFFIGTMVRYWSLNRLTSDDKKWLGQWRDVVAGNEERLPEAGRFNAGQKAMFWLTVICMIVLVVTGFGFWRAWFGSALGVEWIRVATLLHSVAAAVLIIGIIIHVYAAIWTKGSVRAMVRGDVSEAWAKKHHAAWHREVTR